MAATLSINCTPTAASGEAEAKVSAATYLFPPELNTDLERLEALDVAATAGIKSCFLHTKAGLGLLAAAEFAKELRAAMTYTVGDFASLTRQDIAQAKLNPVCVNKLARCLQRYPDLPENKHAAPDSERERQRMMAMKRVETRKAQAEAKLAAAQLSLQRLRTMERAYRHSTNHADFCIRLLPDLVDFPSEPAHTLFSDVGGLGTGTLADGDGEEDVQDVWLRALGKDASLWPKEVGGKPVTLAIADTHASSFRNGRKPGSSHFAVGYPCGRKDIGVVAIGNLKRRMDDTFSPSDKGELIVMVEDFLAAQPDTIGMTAYLTDGHWVQFFRVNRDEGSTQGFKYIEGRRHELGSRIGVQWFWGLMTTPVSDLGWKVPRLSMKGSPLTVERFLGNGSTGTVYHCTYHHAAGAAAGAGATAGAGARAEDVVVKMCSTAEEAEAERRVLQRLNDAGVPGVQRLVGMTECGKGIVTTPLAAPLVDTEGLREVLNGVVTTLERMHALGLVHRDVSKANILVTPEGNSLLVGAGGAAPPDAPVPYHGTIAYAAPHILEHFLAAAEQETMPGAIVPRKSDDLQSLLRVVYLLMFPYLKRGAPLRSEESEFLKHRIDALTMDGTWPDTDTLAGELSYDSVRKFFADFFPATSNKKRKASAM